MITSSIRITEAERKLLADIEELKYGEIYDVELPESEKSTLILLSEQKKRLIEEIRTGHRFFLMIQVHQGEPAYAEVLYNTKHSNLRSKKRLKFT
jgi:hypothetical protein